jgi:excisionase family DNA binding protein
MDADTLPDLISPKNAASLAHCPRIDTTSEPLLGMTAAAKLLGCHRDTVRALIKRGQLEGVILDGKHYTSTEAITRVVLSVEDQFGTAEPLCPTPAEPSRPA